MVTELLKKAFDEASKLSEEEQQELGTWILAELESGNQWGRAFSDSRDQLSALADEALRENERGRAVDLDPSGL